MALANEILSGRFNRAIQKLVGIKGKPPAPQLSSEFMPVFDVPFGVEDDYLWGFDHFAGVGTQAAVVGATSAAQLRNPINSKVVARVVRCLPINGATTDPSMTLNLLPDPGTDQATIITTLGLDLRGRGQSTCRMSVGTTALGSGAIMGFGFVGGGSGDLWFADRDQYIPLLPGKMLAVKPSVLNNSLTVTFWWVERPLEDSELT